MVRARGVTDARVLGLGGRLGGGQALKRTGLPIITGILAGKASQQDHQAANSGRTLTRGELCALMVSAGTMTPTHRVATRARRLIYFGQNRRSGFSTVFTRTVTKMAVGARIRLSGSLRLGSNRSAAGCISTVGLRPAAQNAVAAQGSAAPATTIQRKGVRPMFRLCMHAHR